MGQFCKTLLAGQLVFCLALPLARPAAAASFDGEWNVRIVSSSSACGNGANASLDISNGRVASNSGMMTASGRVADSGSISVTLASGAKRAVGLGHLSGTSGSGTWRGAMCSGTWTAQRI
ncbi:MAG: hypothetical protein ACM3OF_00910 [Gemmatimonas sp.]